MKDLCPDALQSARNRDPQWSEPASATVARAVAVEPVPMLLGSEVAYAAALEEVEREEEAERFDGME